MEASYIVLRKTARVAISDPIGFVLSFPYTKSLYFLPFELPNRVFHFAHVCRHTAEASFRFIDLHVHARTVLHPDDAQECADRLCCVTALADNLPHVFRVNIKREEHAHFIHFSGHFHRVRIIYERLDNVFQKYLILFCHIIKLLFTNHSPTMRFFHYIAPQKECPTFVQLPALVTV